jgi:nucleotide-binding universal stress UspA family protein
LTYAAAFATWYESQLTVLHVAARVDEPRESERVGDDAHLPHLYSRDDVVAAVRRSIDQAGAAALNARVLAREGRPSDVIVACAASAKADLLVMGTHGLGGFHRLFLGSVTERVVRTTTCPVLTVSRSAPTPTSRPIVFKKILCPIDYSPSSIKALEFALELGRQADGRVTVLFALEYLEPREPCEHVDAELRRSRQHFIDHARERLHAQLAGESRTWCEIQEIVAIDRAYKAILQHASGFGADIIVMGAQGSSGMELMLYGSNTHHVVRAAVCPVLTVRG